MEPGLASMSPGSICNMGWNVVDCCVVSHAMWIEMCCGAAVKGERAVCTVHPHRVLASHFSSGRRKW